MLDGIEQAEPLLTSAVEADDEDVDLLLIFGFGDGILEQSSQRRQVGHVFEGGAVVESGAGGSRRIIGGNNYEYES